MDEHQDNAEPGHEDAPGDEITVATPVDSDAPDEHPYEDDDEELGGGGNGRFITAIGAAILLVGMFLTWYQVVRTNGFTDNTTGWQTFTKLRFLLLLTSVGGLVSVLLRPTRAIVLGRLVLGLIASALVIRRIVSPPDLPGATVTAQLGIYIALLGALGMAFGGLLGIGTSADDEDVEPEAHAGLVPDAQPVAALDAPASPDSDDDEVVDADVVEHGDDQVAGRR